MVKLAKAIIPATVICVSAFAAAGHAADVVVMHGAKSETVAVKPAGPLPTVLRGSGVSTRPAAPTRPVLRVRTIARPYVSAGGTLWIIGDGGRRITACSTIGTGMVGGGSRIRCDTGTFRR